MQLISRLLAYTQLSADDLHKLPEHGELKEAFPAFLSLLEAGTVRVAEKNSLGIWVVNPDMKKIILLGFRLGQLVATGADSLSFVDKDTYPIRQFDASEQIRLVPGGVSVRRGAHIASSVTLMPPSFVNVGAFVGAGTMVDSHALVGSCAQVGKNVHLSTGVHLGGVLEPVGERPVIIEDEVFIGGNCGIYEGTFVGHRAVIGAGVMLTRSTKVYDLVHQQLITSTADEPLHIPPGAVIVPGAREIKGAFAEEHGLSLYTPIIVRYRDAKTDAKTSLEQSLRP